MEETASSHQVLLCVKIYCDLSSDRLGENEAQFRNCKVDFYYPHVHQPCRSGSFRKNDESTDATSVAPVNQVSSVSSTGEEINQPKTSIYTISVKNQSLAVEKAANISDTMLEEKTEICVLKTRELLSKAQLLMRDIEELLNSCTVTGPSDRRQRRKIQQECEARIEEDGETLIIEGFRFESVVSREELRKLSSKAGARRY